ncbi:hypothetical protein A4U88_4112 [Serratia marcescens]|nr:hypothetical protein A4U88_4112 [Serratia marcescens]
MECLITKKRMAVACQRMMKVMCRSALRIRKAQRVESQTAGGTRFLLRGKNRPPGGL